MAITIDDMHLFTKLLSLLDNRVKVVNEIMGCNCHVAHKAIMTCSLEKGWYVLSFFGETLKSFRVWDVSGVEDAVLVADQFADCVWRLYGNGRLVVCPSL